MDISAISPIVKLQSYNTLINDIFLTDCETRLKISHLLLHSNSSEKSVKEFSQLSHFFTIT